MMRYKSRILLHLSRALPHGHCILGQSYEVRRARRRSFILQFRILAREKKMMQARMLLINNCTGIKGPKSREYSIILN